ncbi:MAG: tetratricopeptide repeat protein [Desertifilum sp. SIO1I2]|nr:tetratricopeptide repeat protein [Desertifilum sp. SIO1I2]
MLRNIWQWLKQLWQRVFGNSSTSPPDVPPPPPVAKLTDAEYEAIFLELLEGVSQGWNRGQVQGFLIGKNLKNKGFKETDLVSWLQSFGAKLQESPTLHEQLARRLLLLANLNLGELSQVAGEIAKRLEEQLQRNQLITHSGIDDNPLSDRDSSSQNREISEQDLPPPEIGLTGQPPEIAGEGGTLFDRSLEKIKAGSLEEGLALFEKAINKLPNFTDTFSTSPSASNRAINKLPNFTDTFSTSPSASNKVQRHINPQPVTSDSSFWFDRGNEQYMRGNFLGAIASYDKALEIKPDLHEAWFNRGVALGNIGRREEAIAAYNRALEIQPNDHIPWNGLGNALNDLGRYEEAIAAYNRALEIQPNDHIPWNGLGNALGDLGRYEEAIAAYNRALEIQPNDHSAWNGLGATLRDLGRYEEAIAAYNRALEIQPNDHSAWNGLGATLRDLGRYEEAIAAYNRALEIQPNDHSAWNGLGATLGDLGRYEEAIAAYNRALQIQPNDHIAWNGLGATLGELGRYEEAIAAYNRALQIQPNFDFAWNGLGNALGELGRNEEAIAAYNRALQITSDQFWMAWANRGWSFFSTGPYEKAIQNWDDGLEKYLDSNRDYRLAYGQLHKQKGEAHYRYGKQTATYFEYFQKAKASYLAAREYFKEPNIPEVHLKVLQGLVTVCRSLGDAEAEEYLNTATTMLEQLMLDSSPAKRLLLQRKFAGLYQLEVDGLVQSGAWTKALETAEKRKNFCLQWMTGWQERDAIPSPTYPEILTLLAPNPTSPKPAATALLYWHLSPATLTTFILKPHQELQTLSTPINHPLGQTQSLDGWLQTWKEEYKAYRKTKETQPNLSLSTSHTWQESLEAHLLKLRNLLNIERIYNDYLTDIDRLILIPHRDLHLLPLHALFPTNQFTISYLPSAQVGIERQTHQTPPDTQPLLCIKHPGNNPENWLLFADVEAPAVAYLHQGTRLEDRNATKTNALQQIKTTNGYLHFTCHGEHDFKAPQNSALELQDELLTFAEIQQLKLLPYELVCLSACETGLTSNDNITDEFIGLASAFLAAGTTYVMSTLWSVDDIASALFIIKFYELLKTNPTNPPAALKAAQTWMRTLTYADLIPWCENLANEIADYDFRCQSNLEDAAALARKQAQEKGLDYRPYSDLYHWAGYTITGKIPD